MTEFKVGDKVQLNDKTVNIVGGPHVGYSAWYVVEDADGKQYPVRADRLHLVPIDPRREVVARALFNDVRATDALDWEELSGGRRDDYRHSADAILAALDAHDGRITTPAAEPRPLAVGDMVRITRELAPTDGGPGELTGKVGPLVELRQYDDRYPYAVQVPGYGYCSAHSVERVAGDTETIDGVTYELNAEYTDSDGDVWSFERRPDGTVRSDYGRAEYRNFTDNSRTLAHAIAAYGPLTRV
ncbi:phiSA1p31-related protein [Streptomyces sp. 6N106]|uniref:phiSA1p31-related protein n=1 Tax=Streptomyces sp. 6N106 TaxID=3457418 RepID=UPI003FD614D5